MGLFDTAKAAYTGNRAYRTHVDANKLAAEGKVGQAKEKYQTALKLYDEAVHMGNSAPNIVQAYALLLMREGNFERSRELMEAMSRQKGLSEADWLQLRIQYSIYLWVTGQLDRAMQTGEFGPALDFNRQAMAYDDEDGAVLDNMGQLYEQMSEVEGDGEKAAEYRAQALKYYKKAHKCKPRQITTIYYLARMLHADGDDAWARKLLAVRDTLYISAICPVTAEMMEALAKEIG